MSGNELPIWTATIARPHGIGAADLGQDEWVRQCRVMGRAKSRAAFARMLIAAGIEHRSEAAVSAWLRDWGGGVTRNPADLAAVADERVYLCATDARPSDPRLPYPPEVTS